MNERTDASLSQFLENLLATKMRDAQTKNRRWTMRRRVWR